MTYEFVFFRQIQTGIASSKPTSEQRNSLKIKTLCHCSVTLSFPAASHRILGSVKLPLCWNERGWEKWSSTLSIGIPFLFFFFTASCKHGLDSKKAVNISSSYSFTFTFLNCSGLKVSWLWELCHVLFPPSLFSCIQNTVLYWSWISRVTWIHSSGKLRRALCTVWNTS